MLKKKFRIDNFEIGSKVFIIAEAGVNHGGNIEKAYKLVDAACEAGADAVKFQHFKTDNLILKNIEKAPYQKETTDSEQTQYDMLKSLELNKNDNMKIMKYCNEKGILYLCTPFDKESLDELVEMNVKAFKIAATDLTNIQFLKQVASKNVPIILSAGMCYLEEVEMALEAVSKINNEIVLLQCTANYPIEDYEANLKVISTFKHKFDICVGYSDHSVGIGASPYAVAVGAKVIEKHLTLDKEDDGPDHKASITPEEFKKLVMEIRKVETYLGTNRKIPTISEQKTRISLQKNIVAKEPIIKGSLFTDMNLTTKRTGGKGIPALYFEELLTKRANRNYMVDDIIEEYI